MPDHTDPSSPTPPWMSTDESDTNLFRLEDDIKLLTLIGFTRPEDQASILSFARERLLPVSALLRVALRDYQLKCHPLYEKIAKQPPFGCPDLGD